MNDLISRQAAIDDIWTVSPLAHLDREWIDRWLRQLPPAQPSPKRGRWIYKTDLITAPTGYWECSECKEGRLLYEENFCPHCGAKMKVTK